MSSSPNLTPTIRGVRLMKIGRDIGIVLTGIGVLLLGGLGASSDYAPITPGTVAIATAVFVAGTAVFFAFDEMLIPRRSAE